MGFEDKDGTTKGLRALLAMSAAVGLVGVASAHAQTTITVNNGDNATVEPDDGDTVEVADGVTTTVSNGDVILVDGGADDVTINNRGTLNSTDSSDEDTAVFVDFGEENTVINNFGTGRMIGVDGAVFIEGDATILNNDGLIRGTGDQTEGALFIDRDARGTIINNNATGIIESVGGGAAFGVDLDDAADRSNDYTINNAGTIRALGTNSDSDGINFNGDAGGGDACPCIFAGTLTNTGTIRSESTNSSTAGIRFENDATFRGVIDNQGTIFGGAAGIRFDETDNTGGVVNNSGSILSDDRAFRNDGEGIVLNNLAGGLIEGAGEGVYFDGTASGGTVNNAGTIRSEDAGVSFRGDGATLVNTGLVQGTGDQRAGVVETTESGTGSIIRNLAGGVIEVGAGFTGSGVSFAVGDANNVTDTLTFENAGTITARGDDGLVVSVGNSSSSVDYTGVVVSASSVFENTGIIQTDTGAAVLIGALEFQPVFRNVGILSGPAAFDASAAIAPIAFVQAGGVLDGTFIGSLSGTDSLTFESGTVDLTHDVTNDVAVAVASGAELAVRGARSIDGSLTSDGVLAFVLGQDSLAVTGDVTLNAGSEVAVTDLAGQVTAVGDRFTLLTAGGTLTNGAIIADRTVDPSFLLDFELMMGANDELMVEAVAAIEDSLLVTGGTTTLLDSDITRLTLVTVEDGGVLDIDGVRSVEGSLVSDGTLDFTLGQDSLAVSGDVTLREDSIVRVTDIANNVTAVGDRFVLLTSGGTLTNEADLVNATLDPSFLLDFVMLAGTGNQVVVEAVAALRGIDDAQRLDADITAQTFLRVEDTGILDIVGNRQLVGSLVSDGVLQFTLGQDTLAVTGDVTLNAGSSIEVTDLGAVTAVGDEFTLITAGGTLFNAATLVDVTTDASFLLDFVLVGAGDEVRVRAIEAILTGQVITDSFALTTDIAAPTLLTVAAGGTLDVVGNRSLAGSLVSNGALQFVLGTDSLAVSGDVTLTNGSSVEINDLNGAVTAIGDEFTLITAGGTLVNDAALIDTTTDRSFLVDFELVETDPQALAVRAVAAGQGDASRPTEAGRRDANLGGFSTVVVDAFYEGDLGSRLFGRLAEVPDQEGFDEAVLALMPSVSAAVPREAYEAQQSLFASLDRRLRAGELGVWGQVGTRSAEQDADGARASVLGYDADATTLALGIDGPLTDTVTLGAMFGFTSAEIEHTRGAAEQTDLDAATLALYGGATVAGAYATAQLGYTFGDVDEARAALGSVIDASSEFSGVHASLDVGIDRAVGKTFVVTPIAGLHFANWDQGNYREQGGLDLAVSPSDVSYLEARGGAAVEAAFSQGAYDVSLTARAMAAHDLIGDARGLNVAFGPNGSRRAFLQADGLDTERVEYGVGAALTLPGDTSVRIDIEGETASDYDTIGVLARLRTTF